MSCTWITYSDKKNHNDFKRRLFLGKHLWSENPRPGSPIPQLQTWQQTPNRRQENQLLSHPFPHLILITAQWARQIQLGPFYRLGKQAQRVLATWLKLNSETLLELGLKPCPWDPAWHHPSCRWPLLALRARSGRRRPVWGGQGWSRLPGSVCSAKLSPAFFPLLLLHGALRAGNRSQCRAPRAGVWFTYLCTIGLQLIGGQQRTQPKNLFPEPICAAFYHLCKS